MITIGHSGLNNRLVQKDQWMQWNRTHRKKKEKGYAPTVIWYTVYVNINTHTHTYIDKCIFISIFLCVRVCLYDLAMPIYLYNSRPLKLDPPWSDSHRRRSSRAQPVSCWGSRRSRRCLAKRRAAPVKGGRAAPGGAGCGRFKATSAAFCTKFTWETIRWTKAEAGEWNWSPKRRGEGRLIYYISLFAKGDFLSSMQRCFKSNH